MKADINEIPNICDNYNEFDNKQSMVIEAINQRKNIFVTGSAGTGKSYLLNFIKKNYSHLNIEFTASTGIAAVNIEGSTIHSWAGIGLANLPIDDIISNLLSFRGSKARKRIIKAKILAIDEISMISAGLLEILDVVFRNIRNHNAPMGGIQMLLFGDFLQLPPVFKGGASIYNNAPLSDSVKFSEFCFESPIWQELKLETIYLDRVFRQSNENFIKLLQNVRNGIVSEEDRAILLSRVANYNFDDHLIKPTILTTHNSKAEDINNKETTKIKSPEYIFEAKFSGSEDKINLLRKNCLAKDLLRLKTGSQVMMIKNSMQKDGISNGSLGVIRDFSSRKNYPIVEFANQKIVKIAPDVWTIERFDIDNKEFVAEASMEQIPLIPSWAITIHKSQGLTLDKAYCDLSDIFSAGQIYVALSRVRNIEDLYIKAININKIVANKTVIDFYQKFS